MEREMNEKLPLSLEPFQQPTSTDGERNGAASGLPPNPSIESQVTVRLVGVNEMAGILGVPVSWLYENTHKKKIPHVRVGRYLRYSPVEVTEFFKVS